MREHPCILWVDDDLAVMRYFVESIEDLGFEVERRPSASEALVYLASFGHLIEGVILDWLIPLGAPVSAETEFAAREGGKHVLDHLKSKHPGVPVIIFTNALLGDIVIGEATHIVVLSKSEYSPRDMPGLITRYFGIQIK